VVSLRPAARVFDTERELRNRQRRATGSSPMNTVNVSLLDLTG
jgi:hypothetical protein